jgi:hypothetical protein
MPSQNEHEANNHKQRTKTQKNTRDNKGQSRHNCAQRRITSKRKIKHDKPNKNRQQSKELLTDLYSNRLFVAHNMASTTFCSLFHSLKDLFKAMFFVFAALCIQRRHGSLFFKNLKKNIKSNDKKHNARKLQVWKWNAVSQSIFKIGRTRKHQNRREKNPESLAQMAAHNSFKEARVLQHQIPFIAQPKCEWSILMLFLKVPP